MKIVEKAAALAQSRHSGRALKAAKVLNLLGTVRGAVTTVLLAASAIGGAATVNSVRQDIVHDQPTANPARLVRPSQQPSASPVTAAGLRADAERRLQTGLAANASAVDDLRKIAVLQGTALDALIDQAKQRLQARYESAVAQIGELLTPPSVAPTASSGPSIVSVNALVQVALGDMGGIVVVATRQATEPVAISTARPTVAPTVAPTPIRTPAPTPAPHTPSPTLRPTATPGK